MNHEQCLKAAKMIDEGYLEPVCLRIARDESGLYIHHLRWMVQEMHNDMSPNKAMRWLGYIQGVLVARYAVSLDEMKKLSMEAVSDGGDTGSKS